MFGFGLREAKREASKQERGETPSSDGAERLKLGGERTKSGDKDKNTAKFEGLLHKQRTRYAINLKPTDFKVSFAKLCQLVLVHCLFYVMD